MPSAALFRRETETCTGTTTGGGALGFGTIFRIDTTGAVTRLYNFSRAEQNAMFLTQASDDLLYGTTADGGAFGYGSIFKFDPAGTLTTLHDFDGVDGDRPAGGIIQATDGNFYGTTNGRNGGSHGTIFTMAPNGVVTTLHQFSGTDGSYPTWLVEGNDGRFYGTTGEGGTSGVGTVFVIDQAGNFATLRHFSGGVNGAYPTHGLGKAANGTFYGTTAQGGAFGRGTAFSVTASGAFAVVRSFNGEVSGASGLIEGPGGALYGASFTAGAFGYGSVFSLDTAGTLTTLHSFNSTDGAYPENRRLFETTDGRLIGTTRSGGPTGNGTVFSVDASGTLQTLVSFPSTSGPTHPYAGVIRGSDDRLYGTTREGGLHRRGTIFAVVPNGPISTLHSFTGADGDGAAPYGTLLQSSDGYFYGTSYQGGSFGAGSIFKIDAEGTLTTLHSFNADDGQAPYAGLIKATDGYLYGTTVEGGTTGNGTVFRVDTAGNLSTLHSFSGGDGSYPYARLVQAEDGALYGTTQGGDGNTSGTIFKVDLAGAFTLLHTFAESVGAYPVDGLVQGSDGYLYGTTQAGGASNVGTIVKIDPNGSLTTVYEFSGADGAYPAQLIRTSDGTLYGTTLGDDVSSTGTVFTIDSNGNLTTVHVFTVGDGVYPYGALVALDGSLYGTAYGGGPQGGGVVYRIVLPRVATTTSLTASPSASIAGQTVTLTAAVTAESGTPTGSVEFFDGDVSLGESVLVGGSTEIVVSNLTVASHTLSATYRGTQGFDLSTSPQITHVVSNTLPAGTVTLGKGDGSEHRRAAGGCRRAGSVCERVERRRRCIFNDRPGAVFQQHGRTHAARGGLLRQQRVVYHLLVPNRAGCHAVARRHHSPGHGNRRDDPRPDCRCERGFRHSPIRLCKRDHR